MKYCNECGHDNPDEAKFCDGCGAKFEAEEAAAVSPPGEQVPATPVTPAAPAAPAASEVPVPAPMPAMPAVPVAPPAAPVAPLAAPPAYAPPPPVTPPAYAAPPAYAPPAAPPAYAPPPSAAPAYMPPPAAPMAVGAASGSNQWLKPVIIAVVAIAVIAVGFFAYNAFLKPPMSAADYKAQISKIQSQMQDASSQMGDLGTLMSSGDTAGRTAAKASWDKFASTVRAGIATMRGIKPPAEFQSQHDRVLKGLDAMDRLLTAVDVVFRDLVSGAITDANAQEYPSVVAVQNLSNDAAFSAAISDMDAALQEIQAK